MFALWVRAGQPLLAAAVGLSRIKGALLPFGTICFLAFTDGLAWKCSQRAPEMKPYSGLQESLKCFKLREPGLLSCKAALPGSGRAQTTA